MIMNKHIFDKGLSAAIKSALAPAAPGVEEIELCDGMFIVKQGSAALAKRQNSPFTMLYPVPEEITGSAGKWFLATD